MRLDRASGHFELRGNFRIVTALQQQLCNLLFSRAQANRLFLHLNSSPRNNNPHGKQKFSTDRLLEAIFRRP